MTKDEALELARKYTVGGLKFDAEEAALFIALIIAEEQRKWEEQTDIDIREAVADEREACAKVARLFYNPKDGMLPFKKSTESNKNLLALEIEDAIRARGNT